MKRSLKILPKGRSLLMVKNIFPMLIFKGGGMLISLMLVRLLLGVFNRETYGVWLTLSSILVWISLFDIGLGNGLRNKLTETIAKGNVTLARIYISTSYVLMIIVSVLMLLIFLLINIFVNWNTVLNIDSDLIENLNLVTSIVIYSFLLQFVFKIIDSILFALQKPYLSSIIVFSSQLLSYVICYILIVSFDLNDFLIIVIIMVSCPILCLTIYSSIYFNTILKKFKPKFSLVKFKYKNDILNLGLKFFAIQIITLIIFQSNNFIIAHTISQSSVTDYNIAFKLIGLMSIVFTIIITPLWSAVTDSYCKGDFVWINNTTNKLNFVWFLLSISGLVILLFSEKIYLIWLGDLETYNFKLLCFLWLYFIIFMYYGIYGNIINGLGKIKLQLVITLITTTFYIPVSIYLSNYYGLYGLVSTMIMMMLINVLWSRLQYHKLMTNTAKGIWNK